MAHLPSPFPLLSLPGREVKVKLVSHGPQNVHIKWQYAQPIRSDKIQKKEKNARDIFASFVRIFPPFPLLSLSPTWTGGESKIGVAWPAKRVDCPNTQSPAAVHWHKNLSRIPTQYAQIRRGLFAPFPPLRRSQIRILSLNLKKNNEF
jgi:hypothetical protein